VKRMLLLSLVVAVGLTAVFYGNWVSSLGNVMIVEGAVSPDSTNPKIAGWIVCICAYQSPPEHMPHVPPTGSKLAETKCSDDGEYRISLSVSELLAKGITRVVVYAHPNPNEGHGWRILEVRAGTFRVDLKASSMPPLPSERFQHRRPLQ